MDEDEMVDALEPGDPLQRQLARYARVRLEPGPGAMRRVRSAVMTEAWRRHLATAPQPAAPRSAALRSAAPPPATARHPGPRLPFQGWSMRRLSSTLAAAVLAGLLVAGTVFAGSRAGGPLYGARITIENAFLPSDPDARVQAELALAQTRLAEAAEAAAAGNEDALEAALAAYGDVVRDLSDATGGPADRALAAVQVHLDVLRELQGRVPAVAVPALERALERSSGAVERLEQAGGQPGNQPGAAGSEATPEPTATQKPRPTKSPEPVATAEPTPRPEKTPPGKSDAPTATPEAGAAATDAPPSP